MENYRLKEKHAIIIIKILNFIFPSCFIYFSLISFLSCLSRRLNIDRDRFYIYHIQNLKLDFIVQSRN